MFNGISVLFGQTIRHSAINQSITEWFSLVYWMAAYSLCLTAGCNVKVASFAISGPLTITLSAPESHNLSSHAGILSLGLCRNRCTRSISRRVWSGCHMQMRFGRGPLVRGHPCRSILYFFFSFLSYNRTEFQGIRHNWSL